MCCSSWGHKELDTTERLSCTKLRNILDFLQLVGGGRERVGGRESWSYYHLATFVDRSCFLKKVNTSQKAKLRDEGIPGSADII